MMIASRSTSPPESRLLLGSVDRLFRRVFLNRMSRLRFGELELVDPLGRTRFGSTRELCAAVRVHRGGFFRRAILGGTLSVADSYIRGDWDCDDLTSLFRVLLRNRSSMDRLDRGFARVVGAIHGIVHRVRANTRAGSRRNVAAHYDLGNEFFRLWLDETMAYSCGIFVSPTSSLRNASIEKFDRVCRKLNLNSEDHVLEIGGGWGGFAVHAATRYGCRVTSTTISRRQFDFARDCVRRAGVEDKVALVCKDYRDLEGQFDKLASIEMIEAVGHDYLDEYFRRCARLLRPEGTFVLQAIVMPEQGYSKYLASVDFVQRYVFPGGCLPSMGAILASVGRAADFRLVHVEDFAPHYAETLRRWCRSFNLRAGDVRELGCSESFIRLWTYYLSYCEAAFQERCVGLLQIQFDKPECRRDPEAVSRWSSSSPYGVLHAGAPGRRLRRRPRRRGRGGR